MSTLSKLLTLRRESFAGGGTAALAVAAPLLGLAFVALLPFVGLALLAAMALRAFVESGGHRRAAVHLRNVALFVGAPFIGLVYAALLPFAGFAGLVWLALRRPPVGVQAA